VYFWKKTVAGILYCIFRGKYPEEEELSCVPKLLSIYSFDVLGME
jgi:hypothetical protein